MRSGLPVAFRPLVADVHAVGVKAVTSQMIRTHQEKSIFLSVVLHNKAFA